MPLPASGTLYKKGSSPTHSSLSPLWDSASFVTLRPPTEAFNPTDSQIPGFFKSVALKYTGRQWQGTKGRDTRVLLSLGDSTKLTFLAFYET